MPSSQEKIVQSVPVEKAPDFAELQRQKEELFKEIEKKSLELSVNDKMNIVQMVADYSVKDGFELAKSLGLRGNRTFFAMTNGDVVYKNNDFFKKFETFLSQNLEHVKGLPEKSIAKEDVLQEGLFRIKRNLGKGGEKFGPLQSGLTKNWVANISTDLSSNIDSYYSHFIRNRRVKSPELPPNELTQVEITAEDHLRSNEAMLEESYYTGPIRKALGIETESELEKKLSELSHKSFNWEPSSWIWRDNLITKSDLNIALLTFNKKLDDVDLQKVLERARYAPSALLFNERKRGAEKGLAEQIKQSLVARGFKEDEFEIKQNEKGEYIVESSESKVESQGGGDGKQEGKMERSKEGLNLVQEISKTEGQGRDRLLLNKIKIINGEIYSTFDRSDGGLFKKGAEVVDGGVFVDTSDIYNVGGEAVFFENQNKSGKRACWRFLGEGTVIGSNYDAIKESGVQKIDESYYWVGVDGKDDQKEKNIEAGHYQIIKDNVAESGANGLKTPPKLYTVGGKLCHINEWKSGAVKIYYDDEPVGEIYDDIKLCENSKDKLVFYAKKGDEHFVYVDGVEMKLHTAIGGGHITNIKVDHNSEIFLLEKSDGGFAAIHKSRDKNSEFYDLIPFENQTFNSESDIKNFSVVNGDLFYIYNSFGHQRIRWGDKGAVIELQTSYNQVKDFNDSVFISNGDRVLFLKNSEEEFKSIDFDGPVELVNSGGKLFIIESLPDKKRVWEYDEKGELKLNGKEQRDLDLANAVAKEDLETINGYFNKYYPKEQDRSTTEKIKSGIKGMLEQSKSFVGAVNQTIKEAPELFMDTFRAKDDKPTDFLMTQMFYYMFPEAQAKREQALKEEKRKRGFGGFGLSTGSRQAGRSERDSTFNYDQGINGLQSVDESGYYEMVKANREVLKLREPLPTSTFIASGTFGKHTESGWTKVNVPLDQEIQDPAKETTFEFVDEKASQIINLPRIAGSKIITERLKGVTAKGKEVQVKILEENNLGEVRVNKEEKAAVVTDKPSRIVYSMSYSEAPRTMAEVTQKDYEKFRRDFERSFGDVMTEPIGDLGDELDIFVRGLKDKSPREQVIAIQEFCYEYGYYNLDNEVRDTNSFSERLSIMEGRMDELKEKDPKLAHKLYAGICTDFATLTTALLRKAGFVSGISTGFVPEAGSTSIKTDRAHAVSYVLWPSSKAVNGKPDMIIVDGTPSNITPKIVEQEKKATEVHKELSVDAEKELAQLEHILKTMDAESIKKLENGVLEKTLNNILYGVKQSHVDVMERVLNASRYAGFDLLEMKRGNLEDQIEFRKFLEEEIYKEKSVTHENRERRGEELFNIMLEFTRRFEKDKNIRGKNEALDVLDKVFDVAGKYLDPIEDRSAAAVITYLRARKMR